MTSNIGMTRRLQFYEIVLQSTVFLAISVIAFFGMGKITTSQAWVCLVMEFFVVMAYILRKRVEKFQVFVATQLSFPVIALFLGTTEDMRSAFFVVAALIAAYSIRVKLRAIKFQDYAAFLQKKRESEKADMQGRIHHNQYTGERITMFAVMIMAFGVMVGFSIGSDFVQNVQIILSVIFVIFKILYNNDTRLNDVFVNNERKSEFPAQQLLSVNRLIVSIAVVCVLFGMILFYNGEYGNIYTLLHDVGMFLVKILVSVFIFLLGAFGGSESTTQQQETTEASTEEVLEAGEEVLNSPIAEAAAEAFAAVLVVAAIAGLTYMIVKYVHSLNKTKRVGADYIEYIKPDQEVIRKEKIEKKNIQSVVEPVNQSARKLYKKRVKAGNRQKQVDVTMTPQELTKQTITNNEEASRKITDIYEKARYSKEIVTKEELEYLKHEK